MRLIFQTPSNQEVNKNRDKYIKNAKILLKDYYKYFKKDIISNIKNKEQINLDFYKEDFKATLKSIFKKILLTNPNSLLKNYKINSNKKSKEEPDLQEVENEVFKDINDNLDNFAETRSNLIFANLIERIQYLYEKTNKDYYLNLQKLIERLQEVNTELSKYSYTLNAPYIARIISKLKKQKENLEKEILTQQKEKETLLLLGFVDLYDKNIINTKSDIHSQNEVDNFEEYQRNQESKILKETTAIKIGEEFLKYIEDESFSEWAPHLDEETRLTHAEANGQIIKKGQLFTINNPRTGLPEHTDRPKGEGLSPENSINCRCTKRSFIVFG